MAKPMEGVKDGETRRKLRVLIVEDSALDAELVERQLKKSGYDLSSLRVMSAAEFTEALASADWDIIIADYAVPGFGAVPALNLLKQSTRDIPFIILSGTITDEAAVASMRAGAHDYVLKDNVARLVPAIEREMQEALNRQQKREGEAALQAADQEIHRRERRLQGIIDSAMDAIISVDDQQRIVVFNRAAEKIFACPASEALGASLERFIPSQFRENHGEHIRRFGTAGVTTRSMYSPGLLTALRSTGEEFPIEATISQVEAAGQKLYTVILRDISQRKQTEAALIQSEKLATVGRLAATVAHEINNPLEAISGILYLLSTNTSLDDTAQKLVKVAQAEVGQAGQITTQTLGFSKSGVTVSRFKASDVMGSVLELFDRRLHKKNVTCERNFSTDLPINGVESEVRQVFWNLLTNSLDAAPPHGRIKVRISDSLPAVGRRGVRVTIADDGNGIPADKLPHVFEPFFTTKESGNGLGLWVTSEIVRKHSGSIRVLSRSTGERTGTVFSIFLPQKSPATPHLQVVHPDDGNNPPRISAG